MAKEKAREEVESEAWVKERARLENLANSSRLTHHAVALDPDATVPERDQRCVRVGVVGVPNAGKSQLVNTLVGAQISAVSAKTNTTRVETLGAVTRGDAQAVLLDLPGVVVPSTTATRRTRRRCRARGPRRRSAISCSSSSTLTGRRGARTRASWTFSRPRAPTSSGSSTRR